MINKYCDHTAYGVNATFTYNVPQYSNALNVTAVSSGVLAAGMRLTTPGLANANDTSAIYGTIAAGGTGTYQSNVPTTNYDQNGLTATGVGGFLINPNVWGKPLEGDGLARDPSTASAIVTIDMSTSVGAAGNTFVVAGAVLTCVASGAGANQFNAGSNTTLVANLVTAINRAANTVTVNPADTGWYRHKLQDAVFARANPSNTKQLQIMTRAGSAVYNSNTNFQVSYTGITNLTGPYNFTGGVSGCWGTLLNPVNLWPSVVARGTYGAMGSVLPLAGNRKAGDKINIRSHSRLRGSTVFFPDPDFDWTVQPSEGTITEALVYEFDDGTIWPEDGTAPIFNWLTMVTQYRNVGFGSYVDSILKISGKRYANGQRNAVFSIAGSPNQGIGLRFNYGGPVIYENLDLYSVDGSNICFSENQGVYTYNPRAVVRGCKVSWPKQRPGNMMINAGAPYTNTLLDIFDFTLELRAADDVQNGIINALASDGRSSSCVTIDGLTALGFVQGSQLHYPQGGADAGLSSLVVRNANLGQITSLGGAYKDVVGTGTAKSSGQIGVYVSSNVGKGLISMDTPLGSIQWSPLQAPPCLNARLKDGVTPWSLRISPSSKPGNIALMNPLIANGVPKRTSTSGRKICTANFAMEKTMGWSTKDIGMTITYEDINGIIRSEQLVTYNDVVPLTPASNQWVKPSGSSAMDTDPDDGIQRVVFSSELGTRYFDQFQMSITTVYPVGLNTDINWTFRVNRVATSALQQIFLDPEIQTTDL